MFLPYLFYFFSGNFTWKFKPPKSVFRLSVRSAVDFDFFSREVETIFYYFLFIHKIFHIAVPAAFCE